MRPAAMNVMHQMQVGQRPGAPAFRQATLGFAGPVGGHASCRFPEPIASYSELSIVAINCLHIHRLFICIHMCVDVVFFGNDFASFEGNLVGGDCARYPQFIAISAAI